MLRENRLLAKLSISLSLYSALGEALKSGFKSPSNFSCPFVGLELRSSIVERC